MKIFKITEDLYDKYHGCGYAIGAAINDKLVDFKYFRDIDEQFDDEFDSVKDLINDEKMGPTVRYLQSLGEVYVGMCSSYEFIEV